MMLPHDPHSGNITYVINSYAYMLRICPGLAEKWRMFLTKPLCIQIKELLKTEIYTNFFFLSNFFFVK